MHRRLAWAGGFVLGIALMLLATPAHAVITALTPLSAVLKDSKFILTVKIDALDGDKRTMVLIPDEALKGKAPFTKLAVSLKGDAEADKNKEVPQLLKRLAVKLPLVLFISERDDEFVGFLYTNGTWIQMTAAKPEKGDPVWVFGHFEPFLRRTYKESTAELKQVIVDALAGKKKPPPVNEKEKPGLGPEIEEKKKEGERGKTDDSPRKEPGVLAPLSPVLGGEGLGVRGECLPEVGPLTPNPSPPSTGERGVSTPSRSPVLEDGPLFAVIPSVLVGGPLAVLGILFPAVFGGLILVLKRWVVALTILSLNTTLIVLYDWWLGGMLFESFWGTPLALWLGLNLLTAVGALWSWRRHLDRVAASLPMVLFPETELTSEPSTAIQTAATGISTTLSTAATTAPETFPLPSVPHFESPSRNEARVLAGLSLLFLLFAWLWLPRSFVQFNLWTRTLLVICIGLWAATVYVLWVYNRGSASYRPSLPGEGVALCAMLLTGCFLTATFAGGNSASGPDSSSAGSGQNVSGKATSHVAWTFRPTQPETGFIASSPLVFGDKVYVGVVHGAADKFGALYCLERATGNQKWVFTNKGRDQGGRMKDCFSSPCIAGGKLFVGEGFHQHKDCRLFCLDPETGKKLWDFKTGSHTESSPCVVEGKVYLGAGDDGLYCVDAASGKPKWRYPKKNQPGLHVDASPVVVNGRLYCGSGVGDIYSETCFFCLDAATGDEIWRTTTPLPVWGSAAVRGRHVYVPIGNGNFLESDKDRPAGGVLWLDAKSGKRLRQYDAKDAVLTRVVADQSHIYFGSRDGHCYCVRRGDGKLAWKYDVGSPMVAGPTLLNSGGITVLYAVGSGGRICALKVEDDELLADGEERLDWEFDVGKHAEGKAQLFSTPALAVGRGEKGVRSRIYFGCGVDDGERAVLYCLEDRIQGTKP